MKFDDSAPALALRTAAYEGSVVLMKRLLSEGVDVDAADRWGRTPLSFAASIGAIEAMDLLLHHGASVNPFEDYDTRVSPLIAAADYGHLEAVKKLISRGANPRLHGGPSQGTPDYYARTNGHSAVAEFLQTVS